MVRALPASASASWDQLLSDYNAALESTLNRLGGRPSRAAARGSAGTTQEGTPRA
ncbi:Ribonuclease P protein component (fragment) [Arthrobacter sp. 8AJ]